MNPTHRTLASTIARGAVLSALLLGSTGCGLIERVTGSSDAADSTAVAVDSAGAAVAGGVVEAIGAPAAAPLEGAAGSAANPAGPDGPPATPSNQDATVEEPTGPQSVEDRLDQILAGQETLARRIDSLAAAGQSGGRVLGALPGQAAGGTSAASDSTGVASGAEIIGDARIRVQNFGVGIFWTIVVLFLVNFSVRGVVWTLDTLAESNASRRLFYKRLVPIVRILLWAFAAYLIVSVIFRVQPQQLFAAAAAIGVAIGFAAQDLLKNLFGGIILVFDQPFQVGDKISVGGTYGEVVSIGLRSTRIVTPDDNLVSVPNAQVVDQQVANANAGELNCQVVTDLYLPGWADEVVAKRIAFEAAASSKYVYLNKPIATLVADVFKETFLTRVRVKAYVLDPRLEFAFQSDVTERAREGFRNAGLLDVEHMERRFVDKAAPAVRRRAEEAKAAAAVLTAETAKKSEATPEGGNGER